MPDIIHLLPDSVANQIAAGEVIQRPASVVKELTENAIDAGASSIKINIKNAGRTLIQVSDNGSGMSDTDARMAFERHATSKIRSANDLFDIRTMGFRGEALASIAAISDVEVHTKQHEQNIGTFIHISGSKVLKQEVSGASNGTNILVKNLFFNVPARRKFLKSNSTELKHIINEVQRVALANPNIRFSLMHNQQMIFNLTEQNIRKRIVALFGKNINQNLITVRSETSMLNIKGYIGQPKFARKTFGEQFFFVNRRYMKHPFFHRAVTQAYEKILAPETIPSYFLYFEVDPSNIDINIHPTKTEIKFEDESALWKVIRASVREALGKFNVVPSIDFDQAGSIDFPIAPKDPSTVISPSINIDPTYNPFEDEKQPGVQTYNKYGETGSSEYWEKLYEVINRNNIEDLQKNVEIHEDNPIPGKSFIQFKNKYLLGTVKSGLMVIDQKRAHERVLFENLMESVNNGKVVSQKELFAQTFEFPSDDAELLRSILKDLETVGYDIRDFGNNSFILNATPGIFESASPLGIIESLLEDLKSSSIEMQEKSKEKLAICLARAAAITNRSLKPEEINHLIGGLFSCSVPTYSPSGKQVLTIIPLEQFENMLK